MINTNHYRCRTCGDVSYGAPCSKPACNGREPRELRKPPEPPIDTTIPEQSVRETTLNAMVERVGLALFPFWPDNSEATRNEKRAKIRAAILGTAKVADGH